jgi:hypothetical protein
MEALGFVDEDQPPPNPDSSPAIPYATDDGLPPIFATHYELMKRRSIRHGDPILLQGVAASGKTYSVHQLADEAAMNLWPQQVYTSLPVEDIRGTRGLNEKGTTFEPGTLVRSLQDPRGWYLMDEVNLGDPGIISLLNNLLDGSGFVSIPETGQKVHRPDHWRFFGTLNPGYVATRELSQALKSRCVVIDCDYFPPDIEAELIRRVCPGLGDKTRVVVDICHIIRRSRDSGEHDFDMCLRTAWQLATRWDETGDLLNSLRQIVLPKIGDRFMCGPVREGLYQAVELLLSTDATNKRKSKP